MKKQRKIQDKMRKDKYTAVNSSTKCNNSNNSSSKERIDHLFMGMGHLIDQRVILLQVIQIENYNSKRDRKNKINRMKMTAMKKKIRILVKMIHL